MKELRNKSGWVKHTRNCAYERRGLNKRIRANAKSEIRKNLRICP